MALAQELASVSPSELPTKGHWAAGTQAWVPVPLWAPVTTETFAERAGPTRSVRFRAERRSGSIRLGGASADTEVPLGVGYGLVAVSLEPQTTFSCVSLSVAG